MCFSLHERDLKVKIAFSNLVVYKLGSCHAAYFKPYYQSNFRYKKDEITSKVKLILDCCDKIEEGYHAFTTNYETGGIKTYFSIVDRGIFIIPKGSRYFYNYGKNIVVSNQLIYAGILNEKREKEILAQPGYKNLL